MSACARFILVNYKQDLLGENTVDNTVDQKIALPFYVMLILHLVIYVAGEWRYVIYRYSNSLKREGTQCYGTPPNPPSHIFCVDL